MSSGPPSYLTPKFLLSQGITLTKPLQDWLTRAWYIAKHRGNAKEQLDYVHWVLNTIEEAANAPGGVAERDWKRISPVMPSGARGSVPRMLATRAVESAGRGRPELSMTETSMRADVWDETIRRAPADLRDFITAAFQHRDEQVRVGNNSYRDTSSLEMINLARNLRQRPTRTTSKPVSAPPPYGYAQGAPAMVAAQKRPRDEYPVRGAPVRPRAAEDEWKGIINTTLERSFFPRLAAGCNSVSRHSADVGVPTHSREFVGESTALERNYSRYEPTVEDIRPLHVLEKAYRYIQTQAEEKSRREGAVAGKKYLSDQLKGLRQDLRVQNINNNFAVTAYEFHARLCLEIGDLGEFNQCQSVLKRLYVHEGVERKQECCVSEFFCYRLAYLSLSQQYDALSTELITYTNEQLTPGVETAAQMVNDDDVRRTLRLCAACDEGDCYAIARELQRFPAQMTFLLRIYLQRMRVRWLLTILSGVRGMISLRYIMANLGFLPHTVDGTQPNEPGSQFWLDGSQEEAQTELEALFSTVKLAFPSDFSFEKEVMRNSARRAAGGVLAHAPNDAVPSLDTAPAREVVQTYVAFLGTRKDAALGSASDGVN